MHINGPMPAVSGCIYLTINSMQIVKFVFFFKLEENSRKRA